MHAPDIWDPDGDVLNLLTSKIQLDCPKLLGIEIDATALEFLAAVLAVDDVRLHEVFAWFGVYLPVCSPTMLGGAVACPQLHHLRSVTLPQDSLIWCLRSMHLFRAV